MHNKKYFIIALLLVLLLYIVSTVLPPEIWGKFIDIFNIILAISATIIAINEYKENEEEIRKDNFSVIYSIFSRNQYQLRQHLNKINCNQNNNKENLLLYKD